jgi:parallel beta-helix repeat protein
MNFRFQILSLLAVLSLSAFAEDFCGMIDVPLIWTKEKSPYRITGDIQIAPAARLTIEAGVELLIVPGEACGETKQLDWSDSTFISIKVFGSIIIKGTEKEPVRILPENHIQGKIQWDGIRLPMKDKEAVSIEYLHIMGAHKAINTYYSIFNVGNSLFTGNNTGIWLESEGDVAIYNCMFTENLSAGIYISNSRPSIAANIFYKNSNFGIWSDSRKSPRIQNNIFFANSDTDCRYCPAGTTKIIKNENGTFKDKFENIYSDTILAGSEKEKLREKKDINLPTPKQNIKDTSLQRVYETSTGQSQPPVANTPFTLSRYSPALHAAPNTDFFKNADGSKGDIGIYGGKPGRASKSISL